MIKLPDHLELSQEENDFRDYLLGHDTFLIFSPHLDDAVLSMGSLMTYLMAQAKLITVVNVFTKGAEVQSVLNLRLMAKSGATTANDYFELRKKEDQSALLTLGRVEIMNLDLTDAAWRSNEKSEPLYEWVVGGQNSTDQTHLILESTLGKFELNETSTLIFSPLAQGRHIDHLLVRDAITKRFSSIIYYADFPYSTKHAKEDQFIAEHQLAYIDWHGEYNLKRALIMKYKTQMASLFEAGPLKLAHERFYYHV